MFEAEFRGAKSPLSRSETYSASSSQSPSSSMASALDSAKTNFQLVANLDSGALNVPLQAAGQIGVQIVDIVKVSNQHFMLPNFGGSLISLTLY
jgi:hypothetical protein